MTKLNNDLLNDYIVDLLAEGFSNKEIIEMIREGSNLFDDWTDQKLIDKINWLKN